MNTPSKKLLILCHSPSPNTSALRDAAISGARQSGLDLCVLGPLEAGPAELLNADGLILGTLENIGYMAGATKDFFDRSYNQTIELKRGLPAAIYIRAGLDGTATKQAVTNIATGLGWRLVQEPLVLKGSWQDTWLDDIQDLGEAFAAGIEQGIF